MPLPVSLTPGSTLGPTAWRRVTQDDIDAFAAIAGDHQWIHVDVERAARESPFGTTIAHGTLTLALIDGFRDELAGWAGTDSDGATMGLNIGYDRIRFPAPVPSGSEVRATMEIATITERPDGWVDVVQRFVVEVRGGERPACVADSVIRVRPA